MKRNLLNVLRNCSRSDAFRGTMVGSIPNSKAKMPFPATPSAPQKNVYNTNSFLKKISFVFPIRRSMQVLTILLKFKWMSTVYSTLNTWHVMFMYVFRIAKYNNDKWNNHVGSYSKINVFLVLLDKILKTTKKGKEKIFFIFEIISAK